MQSPCFTLSCKACRNGIISQNNTSLLSSKLDTILNRLNEHSLLIDVSKLTETNTQQNEILSYAKTVSNSPISNMYQPSKKTNNKLTATQLLNYNTTDYNPNTILIENVKPDHHNNKYLTELINNLKIDSNNIYNATINTNNKFFIIFTTEYSKKKFLYTYSDLQNTDYKYLFIRKHLSLETIKYGRILYHAVKTNSIMVGLGWG